MSRVPDVAAVAGKVLANIEKVILGKRGPISLALVAYFCEGHILLEDVPGVAKTMLARALARSVGCSFKRIQCTPDLLPGDVTGVSIYNQKSAEFEFRPGPIFAQTLLADEINRTTPRTQCALLEAMAERRVTVDGTGYGLKPPFLVIATQNPIDHEGTFPAAGSPARPLPGPPQLGYPSIEEENKMLQRLQKGHPIEDLAPVATAAEIVACQEAVREIHVDDKVRRYLLEIVQGTREHGDIRLGASPARPSRCCGPPRRCAAIDGREFVVPDDIKRMAQPVLAHRLILKPESRLRKLTLSALLKDIVEDVRVPTLGNLQPLSDDFKD